ncbi:hypothetical protein GQ43DRAFT_484467 [Delitschia confertaspora ATCC 74209]|uniref:Ams2/SPT21 N-terminal domain-containing protein n=1 Tax=Delitschia confertaspora ATCC 74209 TaxID=1513339 RepID=A0A9P4MNI7_9PLEO|nr:hypothetical protein GQ43DRAFT_484467 [Delitschia confertaspora ATCC 74209]
MSSPASCRENVSLQLPAGSHNGQDEGSSSDIPRRLMRVKVLYTFDDQNKSNCLARLPNALNIPAVAIDENTQVGVIELRTCIQAIVTASPELVARLGHDYTVYAYDYSEYETPLVGQGMLSWILASASSTPNAPAHQSQTMVTGRVCRNILGLFNNGIPETLEVKLKLVPVPTCLQSEYVESMERYRNLSQTIPEGFDYNTWTDFLKTNPLVRQLSHQKPQEIPQMNHGSVGGFESIHQMLTRSTSTEDMSHSPYQHDMRQMPFNARNSRPSSPTLSTHSYISTHHGEHTFGSRPVSRASTRGGNAPETEDLPLSGSFQDQLEEGPPKKRARVTRAKRPTKSTFGPRSDSLRVTAATAASVRLHRPTPNNPISAIASIEQVPRAPTPRPEDFSSQHYRPRLTLPTTLRHTSTEEPTRYVSPYTNANLYSDNAAESADDERGASAGETPMEMASSPPIMPTGIASDVPSSPGLPTLPYPADSGFASDANFGREEDDARFNNGPVGSDVPTTAPARERRKPDRSNRPWTTVTPGPMELLPKTRVPPASTYPSNSIPSPVGEEDNSNSNDHGSLVGKSANAIDPAEKEDAQMALSHIQNSCLSEPEVDSPDAGTPPVNNAVSHSSDLSSIRCAMPARRVATSKPSRPRGLAKSQTWSGDCAKEFFSDGAITANGNGTGFAQQRSGSGAKRREMIKERMEARLAAGKMPDFCHNCGEIETPTWRKAYSRTEVGVPSDISLSIDGTGIVGFEVITDVKPGEPLEQYRVFKQCLEPEERETDAFQTLQLCNPCGLWFNKKGYMRPRTLWDKSLKKPEKAKRKRNTDKEKAVGRKKPDIQGDQPQNDQPQNDQPQNDQLQSDAASVPPPSTGALLTDAPTNGVHISDTASVGPDPQPTRRPRASSFQPNVLNPTSASRLNGPTAAAALQRAIQSSPVGAVGSRHSPIELEPDLTPKPTRRLLFPSPRKDGEVKLLEGQIGETHKGTSLSLAVMDGNDKENCPPQATDEDDNLADLFEDKETNVSRTTPTKLAPFQDLLKTPTRSRHGLTPKRSADMPNEYPGLVTPTRNARLTPRKPVTPLTAALDALGLPNHLMAPSPQRALDFADFSFLSTPGRSYNGGYDFLSEDAPSSDLPVPSSPPVNMFALYEDPETSTGGLWNGTSIFDTSDGVAVPGQQVDGTDVQLDVSIEFAAVIQQTVNNKADAS